MDCNDTYERAIKKIEEDKKCIPKYVYSLGVTGPTGPTGPAGPPGLDDGDATCCDCVRQMLNIIEQIINLYPDSELFITLDSGDAVIGTPGSITVGPNGESGIFEIVNDNENIRQILSICSIDSITINDATYNDVITYLSEPNPILTGCCTDCDVTIREALPVGTNSVNIITNTQLSSQGDVIRNEYGMIVLEDTNRNNITFVSSCKIDLVTLISVS